MIPELLKTPLRHFNWFISSWIPALGSPAPLTKRRILFLLFLFPPFALLQTIHACFLALDHLIFPGFKRVTIPNPVFITGVPRSGTTFVHRTLASDTEHYTTVATWEAVLAPSIIQRYLLRAAARLDRRISSPFRKLIHWIERRATRSLDHLHPTSLKDPEEDYLLLLPYHGALILLLAFPRSKRLRALANFPSLPPSDRRALIEAYYRLLQRHLFFHSPNRRLLSKNAAFASWIPDLQKAFINPTFIICVRPPEEALRSLTGSLVPARRLFGTDPQGTWTEATFAETLQEAYHSIERFLEESDPAARIALVEQPSLAANSASLLGQLISHLDLPDSINLQKVLAALPTTHLGTQHPHTETNRTGGSQIQDCSTRAYQRIIASSHSLTATNPHVQS